MNGKGVTNSVSLQTSPNVSISDKLSSLPTLPNNQNLKYDDLNYLKHSSVFLIMLEVTKE